MITRISIWKCNFHFLYLIIAPNWTTVDTQYKVAHFFTLFSNTQCIFLPEGGLGANLWQVWQSFLADIDPLSLSADLDDLQTTSSLVTHAQTAHMQVLEVLRLTCFISCDVYNMVRMIMTLSSRSRGIPCGEQMSSVPLVSNKYMLIPRILNPSGMFFSVEFLTIS